MVSSGDGRFRRLVPVGAYVLAQPFFLLTVLQAFLERGVDSWLYVVPNVVMFLSVFVVALFPALVVGAVDGVARSLRRSRWGAPLKIVAFLLIVALGLGTALVAWFFLAFTESNVDASTIPLPFGTYLGALVGMEAMLAVSCSTALMTRRFLEYRMELHPSAPWLRPFPILGYVASQVLILFALFGIYSEEGFYSPLDFSSSEAAGSFGFVVIPSILPALVTGAISGASSNIRGTMWAVAARLGATVLVLVLGVLIAYLVVLSSFSIPQQPVTLGGFAGTAVGMEAALAVSWGTSVLIERVFRRRRREREGRR